MRSEEAYLREAKGSYLRHSPNITPDMLPFSDLEGANGKLEHTTLPEAHELRGWINTELQFLPDLTAGRNPLPSEVIQERATDAFRRAYDAYAEETDMSPLLSLEALAPALPIYASWAEGQQVTEQQYAEYAGALAVVGSRVLDIDPDSVSDFEWMRIDKVGAQVSTTLAIATVAMNKGRNKYPGTIVVPSTLRQRIATPPEEGRRPVVRHTWDLTMLSWPRQPWQVYDRLSLKTALTDRERLPLAPAIVQVDPTEHIADPNSMEGIGGVLRSLVAYWSDSKNPREREVSLAAGTRLLNYIQQIRSNRAVTATS